MLVLNLGKVREESGGRPARSSSCISTCKFISRVSSPRSNPLSDVRSYEQATSWFPPASSTLCTLASAAPRSSSWTPPRKSWRCDGQDAAGCPTLSRCTWQREQIIWCPDIFKWCHQHLNTLNWALICSTKDFPFSSNHGKIILCLLLIVLLTTAKFLAHLSTQWSSTTKCFHTTLTRASEPICANRFLKGGFNCHDEIDSLLVQLMPSMQCNDDFNLRPAQQKQALAGCPCRRAWIPCGAFFNGWKTLQLHLGADY